MSFYTSLNGLKNAQTDLGVISNNIANAETNGFKKSSVAFSDIVAGSAFTNPKLLIGIGATVEAINQNFKQGPVEQTGNALDLVVSGDGFFTTTSAVSGDTLYTRNGSFEIDENGYLVRGNSNRLQAFPTDAAGAVTSTTPGSVQIPAANTAGAQFAGVAVGKNGVITASYADGSNVAVGKLALATFLAPGGLRQEGSASWSATGISGTATYGEPDSGFYGGILSGALERSNVDLSEELVGLITAQRNFQANAKAIDTATQISQTIINLRT
ncbi:flagellar hook-basal body complex protein [Novosphingobium sp.]|uniref:flagellar hook-basal body complex protein n=1 Tax=Novosphingobium sp. TaxID=1874826 RepID=UPI002632EC46|nr:flagellar hook-basal body complex protein [Novosphingobium sp.]